MAHRCFGFSVDLTKGLAKRRIEKKRIVAETVLSFGTKCNSAFTRFADYHFLLRLSRMWRAQRQNANETRGAPILRNLLHCVKQLLIVFLIVSLFATVTGRIDARRSVQCVHLQA